MAEIRIGGKYRLQKKIGSGSFGEIYLGTHISSGTDVAVKIERRRSKHQQLIYESKLYKYLKGGEGIPKIYWIGIEGDYNVMVMELLGKSLEDLTNQGRRIFSAKTSCMLAENMITRLEYFHKMHFLHRDIKPDNFLIGRGSRQNQVFIIDYGLAKRYRDPKTLTHIPFRDGKSLTGTARYASINTHIGLEQARRDDLESLAHVLIYFLKGSLPWQGLRAANNKEKYKKIMQVKIDTPVETLCADLPECFSTYLTYTRGLRFEEEPDYQYCKHLFRECMRTNSWQFDNVYDWMENSSGNEEVKEEGKDRY